MWLIVGLGNPGSRYAGTPHNLGFDVVDAMATRRKLTWRDQSRFSAIVAEDGQGDDRVFLMKPITYMNLSGEAVVPWMNYYKIPRENLLVVTDDAALPMGKLRLRIEGSDGGHNGLKSIIQMLASPNYARLRIGIEPTGVGVRDLKSFVLSKMSGAYREDADLMTQIGADCAEECIANGFTKAANKYNGYDARKTS